MCSSIMAALFSDKDTKEELAGHYTPCKAVSGTRLQLETKNRIKMRRVTIIDMKMEAVDTRNF